MADIAKELRRAINRGMEGAGTLPAKEAVKVRPADWHAIIDNASAAIDALDAAHKRIATLEAALAEALHWLEAQHEWEPQDVRCKACAAITAGKALLPSPPSRIDKEDRNG